MRLKHNRFYDHERKSASVPLSHEVISRLSHCMSRSSYTIYDDSLGSADMYNQTYQMTISTGQVDVMRSKLGPDGPGCILLT